MKLFANLKAFAANESGAVTVDWVVLTAAIVGLGIAVITAVRTGTNSVAGQIQSALTSATVAQIGSLNTTATTGTTGN
jgi:Flp pilus assembly pilin Flp